MQAESVAQLVEARTGAAADSALAGLSGGLAAVISRLRGEAIDMLAEFEARLDFDENLPELDLALMQARVDGLSRQVRSLLRRLSGSMHALDGAQVTPRVAVRSTVSRLQRRGARRGRGSSFAAGCRWRWWAAPTWASQACSTHGAVVSEQSSQMSLAPRGTSSKQVSSNARSSIVRPV